MNELKGAYTMFDTTTFPVKTVPPGPGTVASDPCSIVATAISYTGQAAARIVVVTTCDGL